MATGRACGNRRIRIDYLHDFVDKSVHTQLGEVARIRKVRIAGEDHSEELAQAKEAVLVIAEELSTVLSETVRSILSAQLTKLSGRISYLESLPSRPAQVRDEKTGDTFSEYWDSLNWEERGRFLREAGVRISILFWPGEVTPLLDVYPDAPRAMPLR